LAVHGSKDDDSEKDGTDEEDSDTDEESTQGTVRGGGGFWDGFGDDKTGTVKQKPTGKTQTRKIVESSSDSDDDDDDDEDSDDDDDDEKVSGTLRVKPKTASTISSPPKSSPQNSPSNARSFSLSDLKESQAAMNNVIIGSIAETAKKHPSVKNATRQLQLVSQLTQELNELETLTPGFANTLILTILSKSK
jgi:hypothetical protein